MHTENSTELPEGNVGFVEILGRRLERFVVPLNQDGYPRAVNCFDGRLQGSSLVVGDEETAGSVKHGAEKEFGQEVRFPGGSAGLMSLWFDDGVKNFLSKNGISLDRFTPDKVYEMVASFDRFQGRNILMHQDFVAIDNEHVLGVHDHKEGNCLGCGYIDFLARDSGDIKELIKVFFEKALQPENDMRVPIVSEEHNERAVIIVDSETESILPIDESGEDIYFKYDRGFHHRKIRQMVQFVMGFITESDSQSISEDAMRDLEDLMINTSNRIIDTVLVDLAPGLNVYNVSLREGEDAVVKHIATVPKKEVVAKH